MSRSKTRGARTTVKTILYENSDGGAEFINFININSNSRHSFPTRGINIIIQSIFFIENLKFIGNTFITPKLNSGVN